MIESDGIAYLTVYCIQRIHIFIMFLSSECFSEVRYRYPVYRPSVCASFRSQLTLKAEHSMSVAGVTF